jgi:hypothetical protein
MKKYILPFLLLLAVFPAFTQQVINDPNAEKRTVGSFHGVDVSTGITVILTEGSTEEVAVSAATTEFRDKIVTKVENGILKIHYDTKLGSINKKKESKYLKAYVSYKTLDQLDVSTGAEVEIKGTLQASSLKLKANTGGIVNGKVAIKLLDVDQNTGSRITVTGKADNMEIKGDTGSKFMGEGLETNTCSAKTGTGAAIFITVQKELNVKASTGGYVKYKGTGGIRDVKTSTGGYVSKI